MKYIYILIFILILTVPCQTEFKDWNTTNQYLGLSYSTLVTMDLMQTRHFVEYTKDNPLETDYGKIYEQNPFIAGKTYKETIVLALIGNYIGYKIIDKLKPKHKTLALIGANLIEGYVVYNNSKNLENHNLVEYSILNINF